MDTRSATGDQTLLETLVEMTAGLPEDRVTVATILSLSGRQGLLILSLFLTIPFMVPVSIPGVSTVFGFMIALIGFSLIWDVPLKLPKRVMARTVAADKLKQALEKGAVWVSRLEKISHPRWEYLTRGSVVRRINGLVLVVAALLLMAPFGFVPFSNTLPGLAILFLAIGLLQRDGLCILLGYAIVVLTGVYFAFLILGGAILLDYLWSLLVSILR